MTGMGIESIKSTEVQQRNLLGAPVERREDPALVTGEARYTDDIHPAGMVHMAVVRSRYAHARINEIDTRPATDRDAVIAAYTAEDLAADGVPGDIPYIWDLPDLDAPQYDILSADTVRHQGDAVAVVVARTPYAARDGARAVEVDFERLDSVTDPLEAAAEDAPIVHHHMDDNIAFTWSGGDPEATDDAFESADRTVAIELENNRLIPNAMEPRASVADYQPQSGKLDIRLTTQIPHLHRQSLSTVLDVPEHKLRVVAPEVGGGFGSKAMVYPEDALTAWCAMQVGRPVKWQATRAESYQTDRHGRDHRTTAELAVDGDGEPLGLRVNTHANLGAYISTFAPAIPSVFYGPLIRGAYQIPTVHCRVTGVYTHTPPLDAYRGAGRPEATFVIERLMRTAAREAGVDPAEYRRQHFIPPDAFPPESRGERWFYVGGDYETAMDTALDIADYETLRERQAALREQGRYLGIGLSSFIEACGAAPSEAAGQFGATRGFFESGTIRFDPSGGVSVYCGTAGHGQGHETTFAQIVADRLGVPYDNVEVVEGDTQEVPQGVGTFGSRSAPVGGSALAETADKLVAKGRRIAAHKLEAEVDDIEFEAGEFHVAGAPHRSISIEAVAREATVAHDLPDGMEPGLEATTSYDPEGFTFPFGTHLAVVEVSPRSGEIELKRYVAVDDVGNRINPKIVEGQIQGGIAQGIGQALYEGAQFDGNGNLLTGSMQDYAVPKPIHIPDMELDETVTPCPHNPLGVKGVGEAGSIAAPPAVANAVIDALEPFNVTHLDMPLTSETIWHATRDDIS